MFVSDIDELTSLSNNVVYEGMVCYVTDITKVYTTYSAESDYNSSIIVPSEQEEEQQQNMTRATASIDTGGNDYQNVPYRDYSHYFILYNTALSTHIGFVNNDLYSCYGWKNILNSEFNGENPATLDGLKVLYLESLNLNVKGNNPHCGYGNYDNGDSYIEKFNRLFGTQLNEGYFDYMKDDPAYSEEYAIICTTGFSIGDLIVDNKKSYYFYDNEHNGDETEIVIRGGSESECPNEDTIDANYDNFFNAEDPKGRKDVVSAAFSVVNVKNLIIEINTKGNPYFEKYLRDVVFKYLNELIPSTAILQYEFFNGERVEIPSAYNGIYGNRNEITQEIVADGVIVDDDSTYFIENNYD